MNIASVYGFQACPAKGGNELHALQLMRQFQRLGHKVLTFGDPTVRDTVCFPRDPAGVRAIAERAHVLYVRVDGNRIGDDPALMHLMQTCDKPIVWEINAPANEVLAFSWLGGNRTPQGWTARTLDRLRRRRHAMARRPAIWREERTRIRLARRVAAATCVSKALVRYATEQLQIPAAHLVPNGADPDVFEPTGPAASLPERFRGWLKVLYAGSPIYPWQGLDIVLDAARRCAEAGDKVAFIFLMNNVTSINFPDANSVVFTGIAFEDVPAYIRSADLGLAIHPDYPWSPWGFHNSPMKMFDYMACGRPVIGSDVGQLAQVIRPWWNGFVCANHGAALQQVLREIAPRREELKAMGTNARREVEDTYNWGRVARDTVKIFEEVVRQ